MAGTVASLDRLYPKQGPDKVSSFDSSTLWTPSSDGRRYNPDELVQKKGLPIYSRMLRDEQVKAVCDFKLAAILARGWTFEFDEDTSLSDDEKSQRVRVFKKVVKKMRGSFPDALDAIASGREYGFSVTEKVYSDVKVDGKSYRGINKLLTRDPNTFEFRTDEYGEMLGVKQNVQNGKQVDLDLDRLIHYVHRPKFDRVYGRSDLQAAYRAWYAKDELTKLWLLFLEKFAGGIAVASRATDEAPSFGTPEYVTLQDSLRNMASTRSVILPKGVELEIHFPATTDAYEKACVFFDLAIAKALLVPNLLGLSHTGQTGAYSQSQTQLEAFFWTLGNDSARLADALNEQLFRDLGDQNWGDDDYPEFAFKPSSMEHVKWVVTTWKDLVGASAVVPTEDDEKRLRELLDMPPRDPEAEPLINPAKERELELQDQQLQRDASDAAKRDPVLNQVFEFMASVRERIAAVEARKPQEITFNAAPSVLEPSRRQSDDLPDDGGLGSPDGAAPTVVIVQQHGGLGHVPQATFSRAAERVAFAVIGTKMIGLEDDLSRKLASAIAAAARRALGGDEQMTLLLDNDPSDVAEVKFGVSDMGRIKGLCKSLVDRAWTVGQSHANNELERARGVTASAANKAARFASLRDKAAGYFEGRAFRMAGDASDAAKRIIQQELQNGVKYGKSATDVRVAIWDGLVGKGLTSREAARGIETDDAVNSALNELWVDDEEQATAYLNTLVRTNSFEALNEARFEEFSDPSLADFVLALRYAAVLDDSTSDICEELGKDGGVTYKVDNPLWDAYRPPNHFNCRAILVPITVVDGWDGEESPEPSVQPQEGFA